MKDELRLGDTDGYPRSWAEFQVWFPDDEACLTYLAKLRWPDGFVCPTCGPTRAWIKSRGRIVCSNCRRETTVTAGTIFDGTHKPLRTWFAAIWHMVDSPAGVSAKEFQQLLRLGSYKTAWTWLRRLQRSMAPRGRDLLTGTVEIDDFRLPGKGAGPGDEVTSSGLAIVIAVETKGRSLGRAKTVTVSDLNGKTITEFVRSAIEQSATVFTDDFDGYSDLRTAGYSHRVVVASRPGDQPQISFASVRQVALALSNWLQMTRVGPLTPQVLDYLMDEFTFRFNHRASTSGELFRLLLAEIARGSEGPSGELPRAV